uniref:Uncharacterized protein n=1 Tax=Ciona savignyi TaxID=51511 RepID=H2Z1C3_CIOSA
GFSVDTGRLYGQFVNYVAGAPRANDTGSVVVFEKEEQAKVLAMKEILQGENLASSFGYDVKVVDITGDDRQDLIVGAPQYYDKDNTYGGAVYIYVNKGLSRIGPTATTILYGELDSSFGNSITNLGDINMDGANDIAIGAPGADDGAGAVYIYHGNPDPNLGVYVKPAQVAHTLERNISSFGYSVAGGLDMDLNYPDLLVGSLSDVAVLYRSRPIVNVLASITTSVDKINLNPDANDHTVEYTKPFHPRFNTTVCMNYTSTPNSFNEPVNMEFTVRIDIERLENELRSRGTFSSTDLQQDTITKNITLLPQSSGQSACKTLPVYISHDVQDKLSPIIFDLTFDVSKQDTPDIADVLAPLSRFPILNKQIANNSTTGVNISKDCGPDEICRSKIKMNAFHVVLPDSLGVPTLMLGTEEEIGLRVNIANPYPGEDAHQAKLRIYLPPMLQYVGLAEVNLTSANILCTIVDNNASFVECSLGNPFETDSFISAIIILENDATLYTSNGFAVQMQILTSSLQPGHDMNVTYVAQVRVQAQITIDGYTSADQIPFGGKVVGESAVHKPQDAGLYVTHSYEITNSGTSAIDSVYVNISWPQVIHNGKWLLYLLDAQVSGPGATNETICNVPTELTNPLKLKYQPLLSTPTRRKRQAQSVMMYRKSNRCISFLIFLLNLWEWINVDELARCVHFLCYLGTLETQRKVDINLRAVVWNSTFLEEYKGMGEVRVFSNAEVVVSRSNVQYSVSSIRFDEVSTSILSEQQEVKLWIIVVATLAGVILLVLIVLLLWKCGFFKRRRDFGDYHKARRHKQASKKADETTEG